VPAVYFKKEKRGDEGKKGWYVGNIQQAGT